MDYLETLPESAPGDYLRFKLSIVESEEALEKEASRTLWNPSIMWVTKGVTNRSKTLKDRGTN